MTPWRILLATLALCIGIMAVPAAQAEPATGIFDTWLGTDTSSMTDAEFTSLSCITGATSVGLMVTLIGGAAIVATGSGSATGTAIALPVLASTMWAACAVGTAAAPGILWLHRRSKALVDKFGNAVKNRLPSLPEKSSLSSFEFMMNSPTNGPIDPTQSPQSPP